MKKRILLFLLLFESVSLFAGPFGLEMGWTIDDLKANGIPIKDTEEITGVTKRYNIIPPEKDSTFSNYFVFINDTYGLYEILAETSKDMSENDLSKVFNEQKNELCKQYGTEISSSYISSWNVNDKSDIKTINLIKFRGISLVYLSDKSDSAIELNNEQKTLEENKEKADWKLQYYVDEFNDPTDEAYLTNSKIMTGTFSNSATTKSDLSFKFLIDEDDISIILLEYGNQRVKGSRNYPTEYNITMKVGNQKYKGITATNSSDRITIDEIWVNLLKVLFDSSKEPFSMYIEEKDGSSQYYLFDISLSGFSKLYEEINK